MVLLKIFNLSILLFRHLRLLDNFFFNGLGCHSLLADHQMLVYWLGFLSLDRSLLLPMHVRLLLLLLDDLYFLILQLLLLGDLFRFLFVFFYLLIVASSDLISLPQLNSLLHECLIVPGLIDPVNKHLPLWPFLIQRDFLFLNPRINLLLIKHSLFC